MQPIIIESDDFGMTIPISRAIITGLKTGVISTTNAQVTSPHFEMSAALAQQHGIKAMGLHLVLDKDRPISQPLTIPSLVTPAGFCHAYQTLQTHPKRLSVSDVKREFQAQIDRFLASGLQLTHLTSHHFVATLTPEIYAIVLELAQTYHVPVRNETAHLRPTEQAAYRLLMSEYAVLTTGTLITAQQTPYLTPQEIKRQLAQKNLVGTPVILSHIGYLSAELRHKSRLTTNRLAEFNTLKTLKQTNYWDQFSWQLTDYSELGAK
ncbi:ChbG/HpnK family deacetylase [Latilactobacillus curvatus]|uniref:ChbG/HpnK family deacetylase n=1 Tax=Latilactobacillus curvatus TaxID=28038 RepID=UPI002410D119|nr:ChbG/HpnK family deacetylase [Latilactobacillus curvatus]MDG2980036.1 ChbG/HpnK family deacetylase [Latilactobacillus curvatus]